MGDSGKKQVPLRLSAKLYEAIAAGRTMISALSMDRLSTC